MENAGNAPRGFRFPILQGILPINRSRVPSNIVAGVTLAALAIPEVMGYTRIAGTPVITGLYTILIPMTVFALFGSSRHLVVGADSATAAILAAGLVGLAAAESAEYLALCGVLALMAAALLAIARIVRLGFLADFLSHTVLIGFLTGVGIQVALGETGSMLGLSRAGGGTVDRLRHYFGNIDQVNYYTLATTSAVLIVILGFRKVSKKIPGALIAVIGATALSWAIDLHAYGIGVLGSVPGGLPEFGIPRVNISPDLLMKLVPMAFSIFVVILAQSAATSRAYATRYDESFNENTDLVGLSLANVGAALTGTFVVNGSPTKTQMVDSAGGECQLAQITASIIVLSVILFMTAPLRFMPVAVLSAIVFLIGIELIDFAGMRRIYRERPAEFLVALITSGVVIFVGVEQGIVLAMILSLVSHTRHGYRPKNGVMVQMQPDGWRMKPIQSRAEFLPGLLIYRFSHGMYYANAELLSREVLWLSREAEPPLAWFCISAGAVDDVDFSAAATLRFLHGALRRRGIRLVFCELAGDVHAELERSGITELVGREAFFATPGEVIEAFRAARTEVPNKAEE